MNDEDVRTGEEEKGVCSNFKPQGAHRKAKKKFQEKRKS